MTILNFGFILNVFISFKSPSYILVFPFHMFNKSLLKNFDRDNAECDDGDRIAQVSYSRELDSIDFLRDTQITSAFI